MVMFLFNVAELIEARSLDRARNAIRGLLDLAPRPPRAGSPTARGKRCRPRNCSQATSCACGPANASPPTARSSAAARPWTSRPSPVKACRWKRPRATRSTPPRSTPRARSSTASQPPPATPRLPASSMPWSRPRARARRRSASSTAFAHLTPVVVGVAVLVAVVPPLLWSQPWFDAIYRALALLIIACPCALVISTPVSIVSGLTPHAARHPGQGRRLPEGRNLQWLALDKTGTLTHGKPVQTDLQDWEPSDLSRQPAALVAASLAARSDHPVSLAVANAGRPSAAGRDRLRRPARSWRGRRDRRRDLPARQPPPDARSRRGQRRAGSAHGRTGAPGQERDRPDRRQPRAGAGRRGRHRQAHQRRRHRRAARAGGAR